MIEYTERRDGSPIAAVRTRQPTCPCYALPRVHGPNTALFEKIEYASPKNFIPITSEQKGILEKNKCFDSGSAARLAGVEKCSE